MKDEHELAMEHLAQQATWMEKTGGYAKDMTLRDYFAGLAMHGMMSSGNLPKSVSDEELADAAYTVADAMLKERSK